MSLTGNPEHSSQNQKISSLILLSFPPTICHLHQTLCIESIRQERNDIFFGLGPFKYFSPD